MIFGKTYVEQKTDRDADRERKMQGVKKFAFMPVELVDGRWVFFQFYYRYYSGGHEVYSNFLDRNDSHKYEF